MPGAALARSRRRRTEDFPGLAPHALDGGGGQIPTSRIRDTPHPADLPPLPSVPLGRARSRCTGARTNGGQDGSEQLVLANLRFASAIAREYRNLGLPLEDLSNEGNIGLIEAARRFDPNRGTRFITYAVWWIRKSIRKALTRHAVNIYVPEYQLKKVRDLRMVKSRLSGPLGREADREEIARELGVEIAKIDSILQMKLREVSLDDPVGQNGDTPLSEILADGRSRHPETDLIKREGRGLLRRALRHLTDQEQTVIVNRFGLDGGPSFSLSEIGRRLGVSRERVRQIEDKGRKRLRRILESGSWKADAVRRNARCAAARSF